MLRYRNRDLKFENGVRKIGGINILNLKNW